MAWSTWVGLSKSLCPLTLRANVCMDGSAFFCVDAPIFSAHSQRFPSILNSTAPKHKQPQAKEKDSMCRRTGTGSPRVILTLSMEHGRSLNAKMASSVLFLFPLLCPCPSHICPPPPGFSFSLEYCFSSCSC